MELTIASPPRVHEHELLRLLETFSSDDIADVVHLVDACDNVPLLQSGGNECVNSSANGNDLPSRAIQSLDSVDAPQPQSQSPPQSYMTATTNNKPLARKRRVRPRQTSASRRSDPNKARNERKQELLYLHRQVHELEAQLHTLQQRIASEPSPLRDSSSSSSSASDSQLTRHPRHLPTPTPPPPPTAAAAHVWQELTERQRLLRTAAEKENIRLKLMLATQRKAAKRLETLLIKPSAVRELTKCMQHTADRHHHRHHHRSMRQTPLPVCIAPLPRAPSLSDAATFDSLLDGVAQAHASVDSVFAAHGLAHVDAPYTDARVHRDAMSGRVCMQISASHVLPFGRDATRDAVWHHFVFGKEAIPCRYHTEHAPKVFVPTTTSYLKTFALEVHANGETAHFEIKQVLRQYDERERVVIVWQALIEPMAFSAAPLPSDAGVIETGYIVLKRLPLPPLAPDDAMSPSDSFTLLQTHQVLTPHRDASAFFCVSALTDFVLRATAANCTTSHHMIEDALLAQAMQQQQRSVLA